MILLNVAAVVRDTVGDRPGVTQLCNDVIDDRLHEIRTHFMHPEFEAVMENVGPQGQFIDHFEGRTLNPGHAIEGAWFVLQEARYRNHDRGLIALGTQMLDWMWRWGWDAEHGGILYFRDVRGWPVQEYWHDMKFWWPHCEAIVATLLAWRVTGEPRYADWHTQVHDWTYSHFPDPDFGEWFGYLHRDGSVSSDAKGTLWKGPFHIPRMQLMCWKLLAEPTGTPSA